MNNKIWDATLYLRLSKDDGDKEESNSIQGQRNLLRAYVKDHTDLREYTVRVDDGFTGSNFNRPAFQAMLDDVEAGRTNCIIVKDLSRLGRNYLETGEYIEKIFPSFGVRFIAINDHYDSKDSLMETDGLVIPFKNLINEAYCGDISKKIRSQLEIKRKKGDFVGSFAVFGYMKDPLRKNQLIIDEYAADIVRTIFRLKLEGVSPLDIANRLNDNGVLSPLMYKRSQGLKCYTPFQSKSKTLWSAVAILRILKNPIYIGTLVQGKVTTPSYKVNKRIYKPQEKWAINENNHEAIIDRAEFESVQKVLALDTRKAPGKESVHLFSGIIFCGECGDSMARKTVPSGKKKYIYYVCSRNKASKKCSCHSMRESILIDAVLCAVKNYIDSVIELEKLLDEADEAALTTGKARKIQRQIEKKQEEVIRFQKLRLSLYENMSEGLLDKNEYLEFKESYSKQYDEAKKVIECLQSQLDNLIQHGGTERLWMKEFKKYRNVTALDRSIVVSLIEKVLVYKNQRAEVQFRWQDEFALQAELLESALPTISKEGCPKSSSEVAVI